MNKKDFYTFYFYTELIGTIIVTMFLYYIIFYYLKNEKITLYYNTYWYFSSIKYTN